VKHNVGGLPDGARTTLPYDLEPDTQSGLGALASRFVEQRTWLRARNAAGTVG
jgi:hypothetical protein